MAEIINLSDERKHKESLEQAIYDVKYAFCRDGAVFGALCVV